MVVHRWICFARSSNVRIPYHFCYACIKLKFYFQNFKLILIYIPSILTSVCRYPGLHFFWNMLPFLLVFLKADFYSLWKLFLSSWGHVHHRLQVSTPVPPLLWASSGWHFCIFMGHPQLALSSTQCPIPYLTAPFSFLSREVFVSWQPRRFTYTL